jgi:hypothetical protein
MGILSLNLDVSGQIGMIPRRPKMLTTDSLATITGAGYLNSSNLEGGSIEPTDIFDIVYSYNTSTGIGTRDTFLPTISGGVITLSLYVPGGNVLLPVTSGDVPSFNGTTGQIQDSGIAANKLLVGSIASPDTNANIISGVVVATHTQLASGGRVNLIVGSGTKQYRFLNIYYSFNTANFSGGSGDRLMQIADGLNGFTLIPSASLQTILSSGWGSTALPFPPTVPIDQTTVAGNNVFVIYNGGTTDYTAGDIRFYFTAIRTA